MWNFTFFSAFLHNRHILCNSVINFIWILFSLLHVEIYMCNIIKLILINHLKATSVRITDQWTVGRTHEKNSVLLCDLCVGKPIGNSDFIDLYNRWWCRNTNVGRFGGCSQHATGNGMGGRWSVFGQWSLVTAGPSLPVSTNSRYIRCRIPCVLTCPTPVNHRTTIGGWGVHFTQETFPVSRSRSIRD